MGKWETGHGRLCDVGMSGVARSELSVGIIHESKIMQSVRNPFSGDRAQPQGWNVQIYGWRCLVLSIATPQISISSRHSEHMSSVEGGGPTVAIALDQGSCLAASYSPSRS